MSPRMRTHEPRDGHAMILRSATLTFRPALSVATPADQLRSKTDSESGPPGEQLFPGCAPSALRPKTFRVRYAHRQARQMPGQMPPAQGPVGGPRSQSVLRLCRAARRDDTPRPRPRQRSYGFVPSAGGGFPVRLLLRGAGVGATLAGSGSHGRPRARRGSCPGRSPRYRLVASSQLGHHSAHSASFPGRSSHHEHAH